jgi:hypothetical protein
VDLLPAPVEPPAVQAAVAELAANRETLTAVGRARPVLLDLGRLGSQSPGTGLLGFCDAAVLVVRGDAVSLGHAREAGWLKTLPVRCGFALVDTGPYRSEEIADVLEMPCLATVPFNRRPLHGRKAAKAVHALYVALTARSSEPTQTPELVKAKVR